jgi:SAM-dependent methyltransferase
MLAVSLAAMPDLSSAETKRVHWNAASAGYEAGQGARLDRAPAAWGTFRIPESELGVLGDVTGLDVLEAGCGGAHWSIELAHAGARPVALDVSEAQLDYARRKMEAAGVDFPLVRASGDDIPLPDQSFDIVFCDHGVMSHVETSAALGEIGRLLRPGGLLAFCWRSPFAYVHSSAEQDVGPTLLQDLHGLSSFDNGHQTYFTLPHGKAIALFHRMGFLVEDLIELRAPARAATPEGATELGLSLEWMPAIEWSRRWPLEEIWRLRRQPT